MVAYYAGESQLANHVFYHYVYESAPAGPARHLSDRSIRSMDRSEIFENSRTGPRSLQNLGPVRDLDFHFWSIT